jgi:hypothetical protein
MRVARVAVGLFAMPNRNRSPFSYSFCQQSRTDLTYVRWKIPNKCDKESVIKPFYPMLNRINYF